MQQLKDPSAATEEQPAPSGGGDTKPAAGRSTEPGDATQCTLPQQRGWHIYQVFASREVDKRKAKQTRRQWPMHSRGRANGRRREGLRLTTKALRARNGQQRSAWPAAAALGVPCASATRVAFLRGGAKQGACTVRASSCLVAQEAAGVQVCRYGGRRQGGWAAELGVRSKCEPVQGLT